MILISDEDILDKLSTAAPFSLEQLCSQFGIQRSKRTSRYSKSGYQVYEHIGRALQRMKRAGKVEYVSGSNAGWRRAGKARKRPAVTKRPAAKRRAARTGGSRASLNLEPTALESCPIDRGHAKSVAALADDIVEAGGVLPYLGAEPNTSGDPGITGNAEDYERWRAAEPDCRDEDGPEVERLMAETARERTCVMPGLPAVTMTVSGYDPRLGQDHPDNRDPALDSGEERGDG